MSKVSFRFQIVTVLCFFLGGGVMAEACIVSSAIHSLVKCVWEVYRD